MNHNRLPEKLNKNRGTSKGIMVTSVFVVSGFLFLGTIAQAVASVYIESVDPADVGDFSPNMDELTTLLRGGAFYLARTTTYMGPGTFPVDGNSMEWRVTIDGPGSLIPGMIDLDEIGIDSHGSEGIDLGTFHYPFTVDANSGNLVAIGSCDEAEELPPAISHNNNCTAETGFALGENDYFTAADKIVFNSIAPTGSYTITYDLVNTNGGDSVLGTFAKTITVLTDTQTTPDSATGAATIDSDTPEVVITDPNQAVTVTVASGITNATVDVSAFIAGGIGVLPQITIESDNADVTIPDNTTVTSAAGTWDGVIAAPTVTTVTLPAISEETLTAGTAIEVGFTGAKLSFDKAVRLLLPGQVGRRAGYVRTGIDFTEITNTCAADNQAIGDALAADGDCKIDVGSDLVIWTKHFTTFATYTQTTKSTGSGGGAITPTPIPIPSPTAATATSPAGQVFGVATFQFTQSLKIGSRGNDVTELQKRLTAEGVYSGPITGYFGPLTEKGVRAFQKKYGIAQAGVVGPLTRARLNPGQVSGAATSAESAAIQAKIGELQNQLVVLLQKLREALQAQLK